MQAQKILDNYCRLYGVTMPIIDPTQTEYFVTISHDAAGVLYLHKASKLLGRIVGGAMRKGIVLLVRNGWVTLLTYDKWRQTWTKYFATKPRKKAIEPNTTPATYRSEIFETMQTKRAPKKPSKRGFERTYNANTAMNYLSTSTRGMRVEYL